VLWDGGNLTLLLLLLLLLLQDYAAILAQAEAEADLVLWDGGNNDLPFYKPDLWLCIADPLRPGHEVMSHALW
jgi:predicted GTPase